MEGSNGDATITADKVDNVLLIPVEAISEDSNGEFVYVGTERKKTYITSGLSDGAYAEVKTGLSEGNKVLYVKSSTSENSGMPTPFGGSRNMGGGK